MWEKETKREMNQGSKSIQDRESKILNLMGNTTILLMSLMTDAFSDAFTGMAVGMAEAMATGLGAEQKQTDSKKIKQAKSELSKQMVTEIVRLKADMKDQMNEKRQKIGTRIADARFDAGIAIAEKYDIGLPSLTRDLDTKVLLKYLARLKSNDASCTAMFQELMAWMTSVNDVG
jgi:hypothetical protein